MHSKGNASEVSNYYDLCRLCLSDNSLKINLFDEEARKRELILKIEIILSVFVREDDGLPRYLCYGCITRIESFEAYRIRCLRAEKILKTLAPSVVRKARCHREHGDNPSQFFPVSKRVLYLRYCEGRGLCDICIHSAANIEVDGVQTGKDQHDVESRNLPSQHPVMEEAPSDKLERIASDVLRDSEESSSPVVWIPNDAINRLTARQDPPLQRATLEDVLFGEYDILEACELSHRNDCQPVVDLHDGLDPTDNTVRNVVSTENEASAVASEEVILGTDRVQPEKDLIKIQKSDLFIDSNLKDGTVQIHDECVTKDTLNLNTGIEGYITPGQNVDGNSRDLREIIQSESELTLNTKDPQKPRFTMMIRSRRKKRTICSCDGNHLEETKCVKAKKNDSRKENDSSSHNSERNLGRSKSKRRKNLRDVGKDDHMKRSIMDGDKYIAEGNMVTREENTNVEIAVQENSENYHGSTYLNEHAYSRLSDDTSIIDQLNANEKNMEKSHLNTDKCKPSVRIQKEHERNDLLNLVESSIVTLPCQVSAHEEEHETETNCNVQKNNDKEGSNKYELHEMYSSSNSFDTDLISIFNKNLSDDASFPSAKKPEANCTNSPSVMELDASDTSSPSVKKPEVNCTSFSSVKEPEVNCTSSSSVMELEASDTSSPSVKKPEVNCSSSSGVKEPEVHCVSSPSMKEPEVNCTKSTSVEKPEVNCTSSPNVKELEVNCTASPSMKEPEESVTSSLSVKELEVNGEVDSLTGSALSEMEYREIIFNDESDDAVEYFEVDIATDDEQMMLECGTTQCSLLSEETSPNPCCIPRSPMHEVVLNKDVPLAVNVKDFVKSNNLNSKEYAVGKEYQVEVINEESELVGQDDHNDQETHAKELPNEISCFEANNVEAHVDSMEYAEDNVCTKETNNPEIISASTEESRVSPEMNDTSVIGTCMKDAVVSNLTPKSRSPQQSGASESMFTTETNIEQRTYSLQDQRTVYRTNKTMNCLNRVLPSRLKFNMLEMFGFFDEQDNHNRALEHSGGSSDICLPNFEKSAFEDSICMVPTRGSFTPQRKTTCSAVVEGTGSGSYKEDEIIPGAERRDGRKPFKSKSRKEILQLQREEMKDRNKAMEKIAAANRNLLRSQKPKGVKDLMNSTDVGIDKDASNPVKSNIAVIQRLNESVVADSEGDVTRGPLASVEKCQVKPKVARFESKQRKLLIDRVTKRENISTGSCSKFVKASSPSVSPELASKTIGTKYIEDENDTSSRRAPNAGVKREVAKVEGVVKVKKRHKKCMNSDDVSVQSKQSRMGKKFALKKIETSQKEVFTNEKFVSDSVSTEKGQTCAFAQVEQTDRGDSVAESVQDAKINLGVEAENEISRNKLSTIASEGSSLQSDVDGIVLDSSLESQCEIDEFASIEVMLPVLSDSMLECNQNELIHKDHNQDNSDVQDNMMFQVIIDVNDQPSIKSRTELEIENDDSDEQSVKSELEQCVFTCETELDSVIHEPHSTECQNCSSDSELVSSSQAHASSEDNSDANNLGDTQIRAARIPERPEEHQFECNVCGKIFNIKSHFDDHAKLHSGKNLSCDSSNQKDADSSVSESDPHIAGKWEPLTYVEQNMKLANLKFNRKKKTFTCNMCHAKFCDRSALINHARTHPGGKLYICHICNRGFMNNEDPVLHVQSHLRKQENYRDFNVKYTVLNEEAKHVKANQEKDYFSCAHCAKTFQYKQSLLYHFRFDMKRKPKRCSDCGKYFLYKGCLKTHAKVHRKKSRPCK